MRFQSLLLSLAIVSLSLTAAPAHAAAEEGEVDVSTTPLLLPGYSQIRHSWAIVQALLDKEDYGEALVQLERLYEVQLDHGAPNLFSAGVAIVRAALAAEESGDKEIAVRLAKAAQRIAPDLPVARFALARVYFDRDKLSVGPIFGEATGGLSRMWAFLPERMQTTANALAVVGLAFLAAAFLFGLFVFARYFRLIAHDLMHIFPKGVSELQSLFFTVLLLLFPVVFGVGLVYLLLFWLFAFWIYMKLRERAIAILVLLGVGAAPWVSQKAVSAVEYFGSVDDAIYSCSYGLCGPVELSRLEEAAGAPTAVKEDARPDVLNALGTYHRRLASLDLAQILPADQYLSAALERRATDPAVLTGLGNLRVVSAVQACRVSGESVADPLFAEADGFYDRALASNSDYLPALYNRSILLRRSNQGDEAARLYQRAQTLDADEIYHFEKEVSRSAAVDRCPTAFNVNRQLMDPLLPVNAIAANRDRYEGASIHAFFVPYGGLMVGRIGHRALTVFAIVTLLAMVVISLLRRAIQQSRYCTHCGRVACAKCRHELADLDICDACLYFRIKGSFVDPKDLWFRERRIQVNESIRRKVMRGITFLLPGCGHLYRGLTIRGFVYVLSFSFCMAAMVGSKGLLRDPVPVAALFPWLPYAVCGGVALILYVVALLDIYSVRNVR